MLPWPIFWVAIFCILIAPSHCSPNTVARPVLVDTSGCTDVADVLPGSRSSTTLMQNVVELSQIHELPTTRTTKCRVAHVSLDAISTATLTSTYGRFFNVNALAIVQMHFEMWNCHVASLSNNQHLTVVSCLLTDEATRTDLSMPNTTDFGFILNTLPVGVQSSVSVVECKESDAFCILRIDTGACINSKFVTKYMPSTPENGNHWTRVLMSMMGSALVRMQSTGFRQIPNNRTTQSIILGVNSTGTEVAFMCTCNNEQNVTCTLEEANSYANTLITTIKYIYELSDEMVLVKGVTKTATSVDSFELNVVVFSFDYFDTTAQTKAYIAGNRHCPKNAQKTGLTDTFRDSHGVFKYDCFFCGMNTYYKETVTPANLVNNIKTMFVSSGWTSPRDEITQKRRHTRTYFVAPDVTPTEAYRYEYNQKSVVDIITVLTLKIGLPDTASSHQNVSPAANASILRVECEGAPVPFTRDTTGSSAITFTITRAHSGKMFLVYILDAQCCNSADSSSSSSTEVFEPTWSVWPARIFAQAPDIRQKCVSCPAGKFSSSYASNSATDCHYIPVSVTFFSHVVVTGSMSLSPVPATSTSTSPPLSPQTPPSSPQLPNRRSLVSTPQPFRTFIEVDGVVLILLEIRTFFPTIPLGPSEFAIEAVFETSNITFVSANEAQIANGIFTIYDRQRSDMKANTLQTRMAGQNSVILSIQGMYGKTGFLQDLLRLFSFAEIYSNLSNGGTWQVPWTTWAILGGILLFIIICIILCCVLSPCRHRHPAENRNNANGPYAYSPQPSQFPPPRYDGGDHWYPPQGQEPTQQPQDQHRYDDDHHDEHHQKTLHN